MPEERTNVHAECDRLTAVAIPELEAIDWLHAVGRPSELPGEWGVWEKNLERGIAGFRKYFEEKLFNGDLSVHIDDNFPRCFGSRYTWSPFEEVAAVYDVASSNIKRRISSSGAPYFWWNELTERSMIFGAKYYAITRAFELTVGLNERKPIPNYYNQAFRLYEAGRFPCGWTRKFDRSSSRWKKGRFVYI